MTLLNSGVIEIQWDNAATGLNPRVSKVCWQLPQRVTPAHISHLLSSGFLLIRWHMALACDKGLEEQIQSALQILHTVKVTKENVPHFSSVTLLSLTIFFLLGFMFTFYIFPIFSHLPQTVLCSHAEGLDFTDSGFERPNIWDFCHLTNAVEVNRTWFVELWRNIVFSSRLCIVGCLE